MGYNEVNNFAASICGMKPAASAPNNPQTTLAPGPWYEYQYTDEGTGLVLDCYLEYEASERDSFDCPGHPESITLCYALMNGVDISGGIRDGMTEKIEEEALASMEMDSWNSDYDRGAELAEERAGCEL